MNIWPSVLVEGVGRRTVVRSIRVKSIVTGKTKAASVFVGKFNRNYTRRDDAALSSHLELVK